MRENKQKVFKGKKKTIKSNIDKVTEVVKGTLWEKMFYRRDFIRKYT